MVGHASVILYTSTGGIWRDVWLKGKAFNNSWTLRPVPQFDGSLYEGIDYIWISHEHPDYFSACRPCGSWTRSSRAAWSCFFRRRTRRKSSMRCAAGAFANFLALPDRKDVSLSPQVRMCAIRSDSLLAVTDGQHTVINLNDTDVPDSDLQRLRRHVGEPGVILNQFASPVSTAILTPLTP
jgi:UDP-MurNAc hydroxylase